MLPEILPALASPSQTWKGFPPMKSARFLTHALLLASLFSASSSVFAGDLYNSDSGAPSAVVLPKPGETKELTAYRATIALKGADDVSQLIVTAALTTGRSQDMTGDVAYSVADEKIARITRNGRIVPVGNGATSVTAKFLDKAVTV